MTTIPSKIKLSAEHLQALRMLQTEAEALQAFVQTIVSQGQVRTQKMKAKGQDIYCQIAVEHDIDIKGVQWAPDFDTGELIPVGMSLVKDPNA